MADSCALVTKFKISCEPSWNITSLSKTILTNESDIMLQKLAEIQIFATLPAAVLDLSNPIDKFIYLMHRNQNGFEFFREINGLNWSLF